jgi:small subunit ribosomal protein S16
VAVKLRLMRMGKKKQPTYRIVASDTRSPRDGRFIEIIGTYEPRKDPSGIEVDGAKAVEWLMKGAKASDTVRKLLEHAGAWEEFRRQRPEKPKKPGRKRKETGKKAAKKAAKAPAKAAKKAAKKAPAKKAAPAIAERVDETPAVTEEPVAEDVHESTEEAPAPEATPTEEAPEAHSEDAGDAEAPAEGAEAEES